MKKSDIAEKYEAIKDKRWVHSGYLKHYMTPFKVMGICGAHVMIRRPRCAPTVAHVNDFGDTKAYVEIK